MGEEADAFLLSFTILYRKIHGILGRRHKFAKVAVNMRFSNEMDLR